MKDFMKRKNNNKTFSFPLKFLLILFLVFPFFVVRPSNLWAMTNQPKGDSSGPCSLPPLKIDEINSLFQDIQDASDFMVTPTPEELGTGAFGLVRKGFLNSDGTSVAIKTIGLSGGVNLKKIRREYMIMRDLYNFSASHSNSHFQPVSPSPSFPSLTFGSGSGSGFGASSASDFSSTSASLSTSTSSLTSTLSSHFIFPSHSFSLSSSSNPIGSNFLKVYGFTSNGSEASIVMERSNGKFNDLHLGEKKNFPEFLSRAKELSRAFAFMHAHEYLHLDIKHENVLLGVDGRLKIIDFGGTRKKGEAIGEEAMGIGTAGYVAPEMLRGGERFIPNEKNDVFSLGTMLFKTLKRSYPMHVACSRYDCNGKDLSPNSSVCDFHNPKETVPLLGYTAFRYPKDFENIKKSCSENADKKNPKERMVDDLLIQMVDPDPKNRPLMDEVLKTLERIESLEEKSGPTQEKEEKESDGHQKMSNQFLESP